VAAAALCFSIRMVGVHFDLNVPASHPSENPTATGSRDRP
jgi:hypothetical protein